MKYVRVHIESPNYILFAMSEGSAAEKLYNKWRESGDDDDFEELAEWILPDVLEQGDFYIEDITED